MHIELLMYASPEKHEEFIKEVNEWKYPIEGKLRKGTHSPFVSELKLYDIRIREDVAPRFLRDIRARFTGENMGKEKFGQGLWFLKWVIKIARWLGPFKQIAKAEGDREFTLPKWYNTYLIGCMKDPKKKNGMGKIKEVL